MRITLTDSEVVMLGWDDPGLPDRPIPVRAVNGRRDYRLTADQWDSMAMTSETNCSGCDPSDTRRAKALLRKIEKIEMLVINGQ